MTLPVLSLKHLDFWLEYALRHSKGKFAVIFGKVCVPDGVDIDEYFGSCGPCPFKFLKIFNMEEDGKMVRW